ncbi:MAG: DNA polymerase Y family protein [Verrucomicrobiota bacterium]
MFAVLYVPDFPLQARLQTPSETRPVALLETVAHQRQQTRILALNQAARAIPMEVGMTAAQAQARCGELQLLDRCLATEERIQHALLHLLLDSTSEVEDTAPGICTLDLSSMNCGDGWEWGWQVVEDLAQGCALRAQVGIAQTPDLALLVAKQADPVQSMRTDPEQGFLRRLPITALESHPTTQMVLSLWGIQTIGDFLDLPQKDIGERLGTEVLDQWKRLHGQKARLLTRMRPPDPFQQTTEFDPAIETLEPLLFTLRRFLETLCAQLAAVWLVAGELHLHLTLAEGLDYQRKLRIPDPTNDIDLLFRLLQTHLETFHAEAPIEAVRLETLPARGRQRQDHLFEKGLRDPNRFAETVARLEALLGPERVGAPQRLDTHRPDAFQMFPFQELRAKPTLPKPHRSLGLPLRRFRPARWVDVELSPKTQRPVQLLSSTLSGSIQECRGPWTTSGSWWDPQHFWSRQEWDIHLAHSQQDGLYRLTQERGGHWSLEGMYG